MKRLNGWIKGAAFSQGCKESGSSSYGDRRLRSGPCAGLRFDAFKEGACWTHSQRLKFSSTPSICGMSALNQHVANADHLVTETAWAGLPAQGLGWIGQNSVGWIDLADRVKEEAAPPESAGLPQKEEGQQGQDNEGLQLLPEGAGQQQQQQQQQQQLAVAAVQESGMEVDEEQQHQQQLHHPCQAGLPEAPLQSKLWHQELRQQQQESRKQVNPSKSLAPTAVSAATLLPSTAPQPPSAAAMLGADLHVPQAPSAKAALGAELTSLQLPSAAAALGADLAGDTVCGLAHASGTQPRRRNGGSARRGRGVGKENMEDNVGPVLAQQQQQQQQALEHKVVGVEGDAKGRRISAAVVGAEEGAGGEEGRALKPAQSALPNGLKVAKRAKRAGNAEGAKETEPTEQRAEGEVRKKGFESTAAAEAGVCAGPAAAGVGMAGEEQSSAQGKLLELAQGVLGIGNSSEPEEREQEEEREGSQGHGMDVGGAKLGVEERLRHGMDAG
eukprot:1143379-Pelagomonas_calceolata.AAC.3